MPKNVLIEDEVVAALHGERVVLNAPEEAHQQLLGRTILEEVNAVLCPTGLVIGMELSADEARAIKNGQRHFLIHFLSPTHIPAFRLIFEESPPTEASNGTEEKVFDFGLPESKGEPKEN